MKRVATVRKAYNIRNEHKNSFFEKYFRTEDKGRNVGYRQSDYYTRDGEKEQWAGKG
jgi:hypothetical protein